MEYRPVRGAYRYEIIQSSRIVGKRIAGIAANDHRTRADHRIILIDQQAIFFFCFCSSVDAIFLERMAHSVSIGTIGHHRGLTAERQKNGVHWVRDIRVHSGLRWRRTSEGQREGRRKVLSKTCPGAEDRR